MKKFIKFFIEGMGRSIMWEVEGVVIIIPFIMI